MAHLKNIQLANNQRFGTKWMTKLDPILKIVSVLTIIFDLASLPTSVISTKSPNVYKSCRNIISLEKWKILTSLQKFPKNVSNFGKIIVATGSEKLPKVQ